MLCLLVLISHVILYLATTLPSILKQKVYNFFNCLFQFIMQYIGIRGWQVKTWIWEVLLHFVRLARMSWLPKIKKFSVLIQIQFCQIRSNRLRKYLNKKPRITRFLVSSASHYIWESWLLVSSKLISNLVFKIFE